MSSPDANKIPRRVATASPLRVQNHQTFRQTKTFVERMPFTQRYKKSLIFGAAFLSFCFIYSAPIYYFFRTPPPPEQIDPRSLMWPGELAKGKTYAQQYREKIEKKRKDKAEREERLKAKKAESENISSV